VGGHREDFYGRTTRSIFIDMDEFQYNYKRSICGHEWSVKRVVDEPE